MAKRAVSKYHSGARTKDWLKTKVGRTAGQIETRDPKDHVTQLWVASGWIEQVAVVVPESGPSASPEPEPEQFAVEQFGLDEPPVDKAVREAPKKRGRKRSRGK